MGEFAGKLHRRMAAKAHNLPITEPKRKPGELLPGGLKDVATLIKEGLDPIHAAYSFMQNFTSHFAEGVSQFPEMKSWAKVVEKAEEEHMPSGPPMSPLTRSYFWTWAIYDLRIGKSYKELMGWRGPFDPEKFDANAATREMQKGLPDLRKAGPF